MSLSGSPLPDLRESIGQSPAPPSAAHAPSRAPVVVSMVVGGAIWMLAGNDLTRLRWVVVIIAMGAALVPPVNRILGFALEKLHRPEPATVRKLAVTFGAATALYLMATAMIQGRDLFPKMEDECSYALGARMLGNGHLWMPAHPLADFFESFFILVKPVYCSIYFPGTALIFSPMAWFGWDSWVLPIVLSGCIVAMMFLVITEVLDGVAGLVAVIWIISLGQFRTLSTMIMSHLPMLLMGLLMFWVWLKWRKNQRVGWAVLLGVVSGIAAIIRPADALAYALPIGIAMLAELRSRHAPRAVCHGTRSVPATVGTAACIIAGAAPFLALQIVFNLGVTGHVLQIPYSYSLIQDQPGAEFGFHRYDPTSQSASSLPEKKAYYEWCRPFFQFHQPHNFLRRWFLPASKRGNLDDAYLRIIADATLPSRALLILLPAGLLALRDRRRQVLAATLPAFCLVYLFNPFFLQHYPLVITPAVILLALLGCGVIVQSLPRLSGYISVALTVGVLALALTSLWEMRWLAPGLGEAKQDGMLEDSGISRMIKALPRRARPPSVVLFSSAANFFEEPVYNLDVPWPDDAPIIRAHDLGKRDVEIIGYYAKIQPERDFYLANVQTGAVTPLGSAQFLQRRLDERTPMEVILNPRADRPRPGVAPRGGQ